MASKPNSKSFLADNSLLRLLPAPLRVPNYFAIMLMLVVVLPLITRGARKALESNNNDVKDWLPASYAESAELQWFRQHFVREEFALVSWEGLTLGEPGEMNEQLKLFLEKVRAGETSAESSERQQLFSHAISGPGVLAEVMGEPLGLSETEALRRLEGSLIGPLPEGGVNADRATCVVVSFSDAATQNNKMKHSAIDAIREIALEVGICKKLPNGGIDESRLHMGGPTVDNVEIDKEGERTLIRLAAFSGMVGLGLSYLFFRSVCLTTMVFLVGGLSAALSLAVVYYFGFFEVFVQHLPQPRLGTVDAILMSMPAVVYVLGLSGAIHIVNYYRDARRERGIEGAAEAAFRLGWKPCLLAAVTTAVGLASLATSDILPIKKFGLFSAVGVLGTLLLLFTYLPAALHRFAPKEEQVDEAENSFFGKALTRLMQSLGQLMERQHRWIGAGLLALMVVAGVGLTRIETEVQLLKMFDSGADIIGDYRWLETNLGNLVPMEVVLAVPTEARRQANEDPEENGRRYRMNLVERLQLVARVQDRIEALPEVGKALSAATFVPDLQAQEPGLTRVFLKRGSVMSRQIERHRERLLEGDYYGFEGNQPLAATAGGADRGGGGWSVDIAAKAWAKDSNTMPTPDLAADSAVTLQQSNGSQPAASEEGRELLRISARVAALDTDHGQFAGTIGEVVEPVMLGYRQRDEILAALHASGQELRMSRIVLCYDGARGKDSADLLESLLYDASVKRVKLVDLSILPPVGEGAAAGKVTWPAVDKTMSQVNPDAIAVLAEFTDEQLVDRLSEKVGDAVRVDLPTFAAKPVPGVVALASDEGSEEIGAVYTGVVPLVYKTQTQLLSSLVESVGWACGLIAFAMVLVFRSLRAGLISMLPNLFPVVVVFGAMGWLGVKVDIGIMMTASVALGVAVDDTVHFLTWFSEGMRLGMTRIQSVRLAYRRCGPALVQTTAIGGLGLFVFAASTFTPTQQFGVMMLTLLTAALIGDLVLLPALLAGWPGQFFARATQQAKPPEVLLQPHPALLGPHRTDVAQPIGSPPRPQRVKLQQGRARG